MLAELYSSYHLKHPSPCFPQRKRTACLFDSVSPQLCGFLESGWNFHVPVVALCVGDIERCQYNLTGKRAWVHVLDSHSVLEQSSVAAWLPCLFLHFLVLNSPASYHIIQACWLCAWNVLICSLVCIPWAQPLLSSLTSRFFILTCWIAESLKLNADTTIYPHLVFAEALMLTSDGWESSDEPPSVDRRQ